MVSGVPYLFGSPERGDIVAINLRASERGCAGSMAVKRIVGLPNELLEERDGRILVDGQQLVEAYLPAVAGANMTLGVPRMRLGPDEYFVMGDNRTRSCDSREFGPVDRSQIVGEVVGRL